MPLQRLSAAITALVVSLFASAALAAPIVWTLDNVTTQDGQTISGSFTYDADTNAYSAINITSTGGVGPFTALFPGGSSNAASAVFIQTPAAPGQNLIVLRTPGKTNAGGTLTLSANTGGLGTCFNDTCTLGGTTTGRSVATGALVVVAPTPVPTMSEWAMILFGLILAGGAALYIQRRQLSA